MSSNYRTSVVRLTPDHQMNYLPQMRLHRIFRIQYQARPKHPTVIGHRPTGGMPIVILSTNHFYTTTKFFSNSAIKDLTAPNHGCSQLGNERLNVVWIAIKQMIRSNHSGPVHRRPTASGAPSQSRTIRQMIRITSFIDN